MKRSQLRINIMQLTLKFVRALFDLILGSFFSEVNWKLENRYCRIRGTFLKI